MIQTQRLLFSIVFFTTIHFSFGQNLTGLYSDSQGYYVNFISQNELQFCLPQGSGFGDIRMKGKGTFDKKKNKIIVQTERFTNLPTESNFIFSESKSNSNFDFLIKDEHDKPILGVYINYVTENKIQGTQTESDGKATIHFSEMPKDSIVNLSLTGYQDLRIKLKDLKGGIFHVTLKDGNLKCIENKKAKIVYTLDGETLYCSLLSEKKKIKLLKKKE